MKSATFGADQLKSEEGVHKQPITVLVVPPIDMASNVRDQEVP